jgi:ATP/maltotriose-dependent transcriptional regulator MalT
MSAPRAGRRLAALSLAGHPDPDRFAAEFSGSERTVAEYLLAEVLDRQPQKVQRLLLRTSVLDRVNGELADVLTGGSGGERLLQQLEQANVFVAALDARRSWFRYHQLFADLRPCASRTRRRAPPVGPSARRPASGGRAGAAAAGPGRGRRFRAARAWRGPAGAGVDKPRRRRAVDRRFEDADRHLDQGIALARRIGRPFLELTGLAHWAQLVSWWSFPLGAERSMQAIELAARHGWTDEPVAGVAYVALGMAMISQGRLEEGKPALEQAERTLRAEAEPAAGMRLHYARGLLEFLTGRYDAALGAFRTAERLTGLLVTQHTLAVRLRSHLLQTLVRIGETQRVEQALAEMDGPERDSGEMRNAIAVLRLAQDDPEAATQALAAVIDGSARLTNAHLWIVQAFLLEAIARDALGDGAAARRALEHALDLAKPEGLLFPFLFDPAPGLLERHRRTGTAHAVLISEILNVLAGRKAAPPSGSEGEGEVGGACVNCSARARCGSCATCRPRCRHRRSPASCTCR